MSVVKVIEVMLIIIFGIGFYVQLEKAKQYQASLVPTFTRRLIGLLAIGFIHAIVLSTRDILMFYGVAGFALLLLQKTNNRQLFWCMIILFFVIDPVLIRFATGYEAFRLVQSNDYAGHDSFAIISGVGNDFFICHDHLPGNAGYIYCLPGRWRQCNISMAAEWK